MKDINLTELFCEILSGFLALVVFFLILDCFGYINLSAICKAPKEEVSIFGILLLSYFSGFIVDAIGLALGEWILDRLVTEEVAPTSDELKAFYSKATEQTMKYRENQWTFYSLYRNILVISGTGLIFYFIKISTLMGHTFSICSSLFIIVIMICIFRSMQALLTVYYRIPKMIQ